MTWKVAIIVITILLAMFTAWREYQRLNKANLRWRRIAVLLATISLGCIIYPVVYLFNVNGFNGPGKILLTEGFQPDSVKKLDSAYTFDREIHQHYPKAHFINSIDDLFSDTARNNPVEVVGYGLEKSDLARLNGHAFTFHPSIVPDGFTAINWTEKIVLGERLKVQGTYQNTSGKPITLILKGLNTTLDSLLISPSATSSFTLTSLPKNIGRTVYNLITLQGKNTLQQEEVPLIINKPQPAKVLLLSASPSFETKFLKTWLGNKGYAIASRSVITKGKFGQEFINMDQPDLTHITTALLAKFDLVIGDLSELKSLPASESNGLHKDVAQRGLGLIVRADSTDKNSTWLQGSFKITHQSGKQPDPTPLSIIGDSKTAKLAIDADFISASTNTQPLITDTRGHLLAGLFLDGAGRVGLTTINRTYTWLLSGNKADYSKLWSALLDKTLQKSPSADNWIVNTTATPGSEVELTTESNSAHGAVNINTSTVFPSQNATTPFKFQYSYWPTQYGWQQVLKSGGAAYWWYSWKKNGWLSLKATKKIEMNRQYARQYLPDRAVTKQIQQKVYVPVPKIYFYILFLVAAAFLWAESKFLS